ncbi:DNA helicase [Vulgatibacter incomptus]|uniref:DNA helicase n=2 Tax=Vulgatibacter incomptus TaxID=1391653 RepID=A0A0K1PHH9_9BACT|nr:DNA helicase [Vulgatibacter incomptus]
MAIQATIEVLLEEQHRALIGAQDGFMVDLAHYPPDDPASAVGLLCGGSRFDKSDDPVEWDLFRTAMLEAQGWQLRRL